MKVIQLRRRLLLGLVEVLVMMSLMKGLRNSFRRKLRVAP
jgi:hypothetical protein